MQSPRIMPINNGSVVHDVIRMNEQEAEEAQVSRLRGNRLTI